MPRLLIAALLGAVFVTTAASNAAVYTGGGSRAGNSVNAVHPAGPLFPGVIFGDPADYQENPGGISALLSKVNELFGKPGSKDRPLTVASLYGEGGAQENTATEEETDTTIPVIVDGAGNQPPIQVFTGADTSTILTQLFSGILDVDGDTFARGKGGQANRATLRAVGGGAQLTTGGATLSSAGFLATQAVGSGPGWIDTNPIRSEFDQALPPIEDEPSATTSELLKFVLSLLSPYFYGALLLLLLFAVAWAMRSRLSPDSD